MPMLLLNVFGVSFDCAEAVDAQPTRARTINSQRMKLSRRAVLRKQPGTVGDRTTTGETRPRTALLGPFRGSARRYHSLAGAV